MKFSARLDSNEFVTFNLRYEELLKRKDGKYSYEINIQPITDGIDIKVFINETLPLKNIKVKRIIEDHQINVKPILRDITKDTLTFDIDRSPKIAKISDTYSPIVYSFIGESPYRKKCKFVVNYDVKRL